MTISTQTLPLDRPVTVMGITRETFSSDSTQIAQTLGPRLLDHRGVTTIGSMGVFTDVVIGAPAAAALRDRMGGPVGTVLAQLSVSAANPFPSDGTIVGTGRALHTDDATALAEAEIVDASGSLVAHVVGRAMAVGRARSDDPETLPAAVALSVPEPEPWAASESLAGRSGLGIVEGIVDGTIARGPLAAILGLRVQRAERGRVDGLVTPAEWMANPFGSIHGGVLVSIADTITGLAAQTLTETGGQYRILNLSIDYLRSPDAPGPDIRAHAEVVRAGRRLATIEARLTGDDGTVYFRAHANAQLHAATSD